MNSEDILTTAQLMLREFTAASHSLGGLEFYGCSTEFRNLIQLCHEFASPGAETPIGSKAYVFLERFHGKTSFSKATYNEAMAKGVYAHYFDGMIGSSANELRNLEERTDATIIVDGLPEAAKQRTALLSRFNLLKGRAILFSPTEYLSDATLSPNVSSVRLSHVDARLSDKLALLIGLTREYLRDESGSLREPIAEALRKMPVKVLVTLSSAPLKSKLSEISDLARGIAQAIGLRVSLEPDEPLPEEDLAAIFIEFYSRDAGNSAPGFRLWVEGESDCRILKLVSKLMVQARGVDLEEGLTILPLGQNSEGGTSTVVDVVLANRTKRNRDIFLFDSDAPGRHAQEKLQGLGQEALLLDTAIACSRVQSEVEIEDFISLSCLDRFYECHEHLRPEIEIIKYKHPISRRIVVDGVHKEELTGWLENNAALEELENLIFVLCDIRNQFSLRNFSLMNDRAKWKKQLVEELRTDKHFGKRPSNWG